MPVYAQQTKIVRPRERLGALAAVVVVQLVFGFVLLRGLHVDVSRSRDLVAQLVSIALPKPPPPPVQPPPPPRPSPKAKHEQSAPKAAPVKLGGSPGAKPAHATPSVAPVVAVKPTAAPSGGGSGTGPAAGAGAGGGTGGNGYGDDEGGSDLELISGDITDRDYPRDLGEAGVGGHVSATFTVLTNGRAVGCHITRSSRVSELDSLTCRLIEQRFRFRPGTDRYGRPVSEEADYDYDWVAR
jgi:protein TonB